MQLCTIDLLAQVLGGVEFISGIWVKREPFFPPLLFYVINKIFLIFTVVADPIQDKATQKHSYAVDML